MRKHVNVGIGILVIIGVIVLCWYLFVTEALVVRGVPDRRVIESMCDYEGIRSAVSYSIDGNPSAPESVYVSAQMGCDDYRATHEQIIFGAEKANVSRQDITMRWLSFDSLEIRFRKELQVISKVNKVSFPDSTLNAVVVYRTID